MEYLTVEQLTDVLGEATNAIAELERKVVFFKKVKTAIEELEVRRAKDPTVRSLEFPAFCKHVESAHKSLARALRQVELVSFEVGRIKLRADSQNTNYLSLHKGVLKDLLEQYAGVEWKKIMIERC